MHLTHRNYCLCPPRGTPSVDHAPSDPMPARHRGDVSATSLVLRKHGRVLGLAPLPAPLHPHDDPEPVLRRLLPGSRRTVQGDQTSAGVTPSAMRPRSNVCERARPRATSAHEARSGGTISDALIDERRTTPTNRHMVDNAIAADSRAGGGSDHHSVEPPAIIPSRSRWSRRSAPNQISKRIISAVSTRAALATDKTLSSSSVRHSKLSI